MSATNLVRGSYSEGAAHKETATGLAANIGVHGRAGQLLALHINNTDSATVYIKLYDTKEVLSTGLTVPWMAIAMPATTERFIVFSRSGAGGGASFSPDLSIRASDARMVASGTDGSAPGANVAITAYTRD